MKEKVKKFISEFILTEADIESVIWFAGKRDECPMQSRQRSDLTWHLRKRIEVMGPRKQWELMCLMYLGRNIEYCGIEEALADFQNRMEEDWRGCSEPEYPACKTQIGKWLRMAMEALGKC